MCIYAIQQFMSICCQNLLDLHVHVTNQFTKCIIRLNLMHNDNKDNIGLNTNYNGIDSYIGNGYN